MEALMSLHNLINQELNNPNKRHLQRHVQKLASAAEVSFVQQTLLQNQNRFLSKINNKVKARRSTRSVVLGKAKVMSYKNLKEAQAKRATKDKATTAKDKGKRSRPRTNPAPETAGDAVPPEEEAESSAPKNKVTGLSEVGSARPLFPWRAPVARMY